MDAANWTELTIAGGDLDADPLPPGDPSVGAEWKPTIMAFPSHDAAKKYLREKSTGGAVTMAHFDPDVDTAGSYPSIIKAVTTACVTYKNRNLLVGIHVDDKNLLDQYKGIIVNELKLNPNLLERVHLYTLA